jgi:hypothetical protein
VATESQAKLDCAPDENRVRQLADLAEGSGDDEQAGKVQKKIKSRGSSLQATIPKHEYAGHKYYAEHKYIQ